MDIVLKKIVDMDLLIKSVEKNYDFYTNAHIDKLILNGDEKTIDDISLQLFENGKINLSDSEFTQFLSYKNWKQNYEIGKILYKKLSVFSDKSGFLSDYSFYTYITHIPCVKKYIIKRFISSVDTENEEDSKIKLKEKILKYFFCKGQLDRTGVIFYWKLTEYMHYGSNYFDKGDELSLVAFNFIDSVKAIYERNFSIEKKVSKNPYIIKAFTEGIIRNSKSSAFKDIKYRSIIPTHISNVAAVNCFDAYTYEELVDKITYEQKILIDDYINSRSNKIIDE